MAKRNKWAEAEAEEKKLKEATCWVCDTRKVSATAHMLCGPCYNAHQGSVDDCELCAKFQY